MSSTDVEELRVEVSQRDKALIVLHSQLLFTDLFFKDEFTIPQTSEDMPEEWRGQMLKSEKQRVMICDRSRQIAFRTSRKISKCLPGYMTVVDYRSGRKYSLDEIYAGARPAILTLDDEYGLVPTDNYSIYRNFAQDVFRLTLQNGQFIDLTSNHPVMTGRGWVPAGKLEPEDLVAVPRIIPSAANEATITEDEAAILGYLIADGGVTGKRISYTKKDMDLVSDLSDRLGRMSCALVRKKNTEYDYSVVNEERLKGKRSRIRRLLRKFGIDGEYSYEKHVPEAIFTQPLDIISIFLRTLFSGDGTVSIRGNNTAIVSYSSTSEWLARDVHHLLLRFGISCSISFYENDFRGCWVITTCNKDDIIRFNEKIGFLGKKGRRIRRYIEKISGNDVSKHDRVPSRIILDELDAVGKTPGWLSWNYGISSVGAYVGLTRDKCLRVAGAIDSDGLRNLAGGDVAWFGVKSFEFIGEMETYDLSVPPHRNFVVNDFIVHNSQVLASRLFQWTLWHAGQRMTDGLMHCPREHHLTKLKNVIVAKRNHNPFLALIITKINNSKGLMDTSTGIIWYMRIEGRTGTGESMVGPAAMYEIGDEQDYAGWGAFNERQQAMLPGAMRILGGVPRGVQGGPFWTIANKGDFSEGWSVFTGKDGYNCFINPIYRSPEARRELEIKHGGTETQPYQTQVLGLDGAKVFSSFFVIPTVVREFTLVEVTGEDVDNGHLLSALAGAPWTPSETYVIAGDIGGSPSPSELMVACWLDGAWIQIGRIHLTLSDSYQTAACIHQINISLPHPAALIMIDAHSHGAGVFDWLHKNEKWVLHSYHQKVVDAEFASYIEDERKLVHPACKHVVRTTNAGWYCDVCGLPIFRRDDLTPARVQSKQWAFAATKDSFAAGQRWITDQGQKMDYPPLVLNVNDEPLILSLEGTTEKETVGGMIQWDAPSRHLVDMVLAMVIGITRMSNIGRENETPDWLDEVGWTGGDGSGQSLPWEVDNVSVRTLR